MWLDDPAEEADPNRMGKRFLLVGREDRIDLPLAADGGAVVCFVPEK